MDALWTLLVVVCCSLPTLGLDENGLEPKEENRTLIELFPPRPTYAGQTRKPRTLLKKLHSGAAFLAGLKIGSVLSKKGFELGHGKIASTHSFQIFGKSVNSAMSLSYGNPGSLLPLVDDAPEEDGASKRSTFRKGNKTEVFHVTVVESPDDSEKSSEDGSEKKSEDVILLYQDAVPEGPDAGETEANFLEEHNNRVKDFNAVLSRRANSKF